jgi:hypothetical protein
MRKIIMTDGTRTKSMNPWDVDDNTGWNVVGDDGEVIDYGTVSWAFRGLQVIGGGVASVPFDVLNASGEVIDSSEDYKNKIGILQDPKRLFSLMAQSRTLTGSAYVHLLRNTRVIKEMVYRKPTSITPEYDQKTGNLTGYKRATNDGNDTELSVKDVIASWYADPTVEIGEPNSYPMKAAFSAVGALDSMNKFVTAYFQRGAIKATLFTLDGNPDDDKVEDMQNYLSKMLSGIKNAFRVRLFQAGAVNPVVVGEGLEALTNETLTENMREDISTALGIPQTILFSTGASGIGGGGVVTTDRLSLYRDTIVPETQAIFDDINRHFASIGVEYRFVERSETMDVFQADENARSSSVATYASTIKADPAAAEIAFDILGVELSDEARKKLEAYAENQTFTPIPEYDTPDLANEDLKRWRKKALKNIGKEVSFVSDTIPHAMQVAIRSQLLKCKTADEVAHIFERAIKRGEAESLAALVDKISVASELL